MAKTQYRCGHCGAVSPKWHGQCGGCGQWNTMAEETRTAKKAVAGYAGEAWDQVISMSSVPLSEETRLPTGLSELDRVLGGGLVQGSVVLIGGDPGIGKSTILLQALTKMAERHSVLYVTGEESLQQVVLRAKRLGLSQDKVRLLAQIQVEEIIALLNKHKPSVVVIDSIQTLISTELNSAAGTVSQVRQSAAQVVAYAKQTQTAIFLVGHVTKEGALAGPRVLEHMVDSVLYFEGEADSRFRAIRAVKNRFGAVNELGVFAMTDKGLREVSHPQAIFLSHPSEPSPGSLVSATWEGSRPLLVEVQALVDQSALANPRRVAVGVDANRLAMILASLHKHAGVVTHNQDIFLNVVGGLRIQETGLDLAMVLAVFSSLRNRVMDQQLVVFGEVGLGGEIRPVTGGYDRLQTAHKHGLKRAIVPKANGRKAVEGMQIQCVSHLSDVFDLL